MSSTKELKSLLQLLRAQGVVSYKASGIEILLDPNFVVTKTQRLPKDAPRRNSSIQAQVDMLVPQLTDEEWLLATSQPEESN